jgi:ATPase subunit of ABC transporter with duplicated ATPase domains
LPADNSLAKTALFQILAGESGAGLRQLPLGPDRLHRLLPEGEQPVLRGRDVPLVQWLLQYAPEEGLSFARSFLGRMLFSGEEAMKKTGVLSGGEKVRCMLARMMLGGSNVLLLDEPTNHLDLESITALNDGLVAFSEVILFASNDHQFVATVANRIVELTPEGSIDRTMNFDDYLASAVVAAERQSHYCGKSALAY